MKKITILICFFLVSNVFGQWNSKTIKGNGPQLTKEITTNSYEGISVTGAFFVNIIKGTEGKITIKAQENLMKYILIEVKNNELLIQTEKGFNLSYSKNSRIEIIVPVQEISFINLTGSGDVISDFNLQANNFKINLVGSGDIKIGVNCTDLEANLSGSGDIKLKGKTNQISAIIAGCGDIEAFEVDAENAKAEVSGSGDIQVTCSEFIEARVSGSGDIEYKGKPKKQDTKVSGSGSISMK
jgi:hypothetical protein